MYLTRNERKATEQHRVSDVSMGVKDIDGRFDYVVKE